MPRYYFAYGSNMDEGRMKERGVRIINKYPGKLIGWKLVFHEFLRDSGVYADIVEATNCFVEGIVYEVDESVDLLDEFENVPVDYLRKEMIIESMGKQLLCIVFVGNKANISGESRPKQKYLNHLLKAGLVSKTYYQKLEQTKTSD